jgi:ComF family protein
MPQLIRDVVDFVYPGRCASCGAGCEGSNFICHQCEVGLDHLAGAPACERCALPVVTRGSPCPWCRGRGVYPFDGIVRLGRFDDPLKELIHAMKYRRRWPLAECLAQRLCDEERVKRVLAQADVVIPVPLHWARQIGRGYNQADVLASAIAKRGGLPLVRSVKRTRSTWSQTGIHSRTVREENVRGAFALRNPRTIAGKRVIVVDDVLTTAATLQAVGRLIKAAKPASIFAVVLAVADPKGQDFQGI